MKRTVPILRIGETLITSVQIELDDEAVEAFQGDVLSTIERTGATGLVVDISALDALDTYAARMLVSTGRMARLMGTVMVIVGMRPEVAATLVRMGFPFLEVLTALSLEEGLALLRERPRGA